MENKDIKIFNGETLPEKKNVSQNENLMQMRSNYVAAMTVPKPRNMKNIISAVMEEAVAAKDDFYYSWLVNNKKTGKKDLIEGGTIGLAQAIARNWTNCAIETEVREFGGEWIFKTTFVDFEKGFTTQREYRMLIPQKGDGKYDYERTRNMKFQIGQSKNQRDCIFNSIPRWLKNQAIDAAKKASQNDAGQNTDKKLKKALDSFESKGISEQDLLGYFGKSSVNEFDAKIVTQLRNLWVQLDNNETSVEAIKRAAQDVFDEKPKQSRQRKKQKEPQSEKAKEPAKDAAPKSELMSIVKSFELRGISETEICAYFGVDDLIEMDSETGIAELREVITNIEGENMEPKEFQMIAVKRFERRQKEKL